MTLPTNLSEAEIAKTLATMTQINEANTNKTSVGRKDIVVGENDNDTESDSSNSPALNKDTPGRKDNTSEATGRVLKAPPSIKDQRHTIEQSEAMNDLFINYAKATKQKFDLLDAKGNKEHKANISNHMIVESSKETIVVPMKVFEDSPCKNLCELAKIPYKYGSSTLFYKDMENFDVFISPLKHMILNSDRHTLRQAAAMKLPDDLQRASLSNYAFELAYVNSVSKFTNSQIREQLFNFFASVFDSREHSHIRDLLQEDRSKAVMLIDRSTPNRDHNNNIITTADLMAAALFATDGNKNLVIDFVCAAPGYFNQGYGVFLIHVAQVLGMEVIRQETKDDDANPSIVPTYLSCNNDLLNLYTWLGFKQVPYKEFLPPNGSLKYFGKRMEITNWIEDSEQIRLKCLCLRKWCPRWLSKLAPPALDIEGSLYRQTYARFRAIKTPRRITDLFKLQFENMLDGIKYRSVEQNDIAKYQSSKSLTQFLQHIEKDLMVFKVGKMIKNCFLTEGGILQSQTHSFSTSTILALQHLELRIISQDLDESRLDKIGLWVSVQCSSCKKHCYCRKLGNENFMSFMTKLIYSVWYVHIFGYRNNTSNEWYDCNSDWNSCPKRVGKYLHNMKQSINHDYKHLLSVESRQKRLFIWRRYIESYFEHMKEHMLSMYDALVIFGIACEQDSQKQSPSFTSRPRRNKRKCCTNDNSEKNKDSQRYTEMSESDKKTFNSRQRSKKKQEQNAKLARHTAEEMWQVTMENDLKLQLSFHYIQYIDCVDSSKLLDVSKEYLKSREEFKDNDYIDHHGDVHKKEHFLTYKSNKRNAFVVDETWFNIYDENMNIVSERITSSTINKCRRHPNTIFELSKEDKNRIKKHVDYALNKCQIHRIKRVRTNPKNDEDYETVTFFEHRRNEEEQQSTSKILKHKSYSRYDFLGFDADGRSHRISRDWIELNFKGGPYHSFYKDTLSLKPGQNINVPDGYSKLQESGIVIDAKDKGVETKYVQRKNEPSCLFVSLASALTYVGDEFGGCKIMDVYSKLYQSGNKKFPDMKDILRITNENRYHVKGEKRFKYQIQKVKQPCVEMIINDNTMKLIYHCTLANNHAICLHGDWIFDPVVQFIYKRSVVNFRKAAEANDCEETSKLIKVCYKYIL